MAAVALGAALTSYQGVVLTGLVALVAVARWRGGRAPRREEVAAAAACAAAVLATAAWMAWASGGWSDIVDQLRVRSAGPVGLWPWLVRQLDHLRQTFPAWTVVALPVLLWCGWRHPRTRLVIGLGSAVCLVMAAGLRDGAYVHEYWNQWLVIPIAIGGAAAAEAAIGRLERSGASRGGGVVIAVAVIALFGVATTPSEVGVAIDRGVDDGRAAAAVTLRPGQDAAYVFPAAVPPGAWYAYATRLPVTALPDASAVASLARLEPDVEVLVSRPALQFSAYDDRWDDLAAIAVERYDWALVVRAPDLAAALAER
jgi:hypothetical protein